MIESRTFLQIVIHELKHSLGAVISSAEVLRECHTSMRPEKLELWLGRIVQHGLKMSSIINELLLLCNSAEAEVETEPLNMAEIVSDTQQYLADMIEAYQASIVAPSTWPMAMGYAPWIERVWANYLSNAMKYGGRSVRIELGATRQMDGMTRFWVRDNGGGLTLDEQAKLFKPFTQLDATQANGNGLGLFIVQHLVQALGGQVGVESDGIPGQGCTFFFTLPSQPREPNAVDPTTLASVDLKPRGRVQPSPNDWRDQEPPEGNQGLHTIQRERQKDRPPALTCYEKFGNGQDDDTGSFGQI